MQRVMIYCYRNDYKYMQGLVCGLHAGAIDYRARHRCFR